MFGMGMPEILLIMAIALIVIGPKKLPDLAKSMGKAFGEFKRATQDFKQALDVDGDLRTVKRSFEDIDLGKIADAVPARPTSEAAAGEAPTTGAHPDDDPAAKDPQGTGPAAGKDSGTI